MSKFDSKLFGENIKKYRKINGLSQENLAIRLNKSVGTISRFESGELLPNAEEIHILCDEFGISEADLFERQYITANKENISNPFGVNILYVYFNAFIPKLKKFKKEKFILRMQEKTDRCEVQIESSHDSTIYSNGYMLSDNAVAFISMQNHKPNRQRLDMCEMIININDRESDLMLGAYLGTNSQYEPSIRKCYFSKKDIEFTDEMLEELKPRDYEIKKLEDTYALYLDIFNK